MHKLVIKTHTISQIIITLKTSYATNWADADQMQTIRTSAVRFILEGVTVKWDKTLTSNDPNPVDSSITFFFIIILHAKYEKLVQS